MRLQRIKIEGYRSLKSIEWEPHALNVLIGANATGKSNFLHALELLAAAARGELERTVLERGGIVPLLWNGTAEKLAFELDASLPSGTASYVLHLARAGASGIHRVAADQVLARDGERANLLADHDEAVASGRESILARVRAAEHGEVAAALKRGLESWSIHHDLRTDQGAPVRQSAVTRYERRLAPDGQNLVAVLHTLYTEHREFEEYLDRAMYAAFPSDYEKLSFPAVPEHGRISLAVRWRGASQPARAQDLSDGTLRFLMLFAILAQPEPPALIAVDEPEAGLHPNMLPIVTELAEQAAARTQVILASHSPDLLDTFRESPPAVTVFKWADDHTELATLAGDKLRYWIADYTLGRFAFSGEAEAVT